MPFRESKFKKSPKIESNKEKEKKVEPEIEKVEKEGIKEEKEFKKTVGKDLEKTREELNQVYEKEENIFEKEPLVSENFEIYYNDEIKNILEDGDEKKFDEIKEFVDKILGSERDMEGEKSKIYLFSDKEKYSKFLEKKFPNIRPEPATFDKETKSVFKYVSVLKKEEIEKYKNLLQEKGISEEEIKNTARSGMFSGVGHELGHLHPFFGGVGNEESENKWEQEMVCIFIGEKIRTDFGNKRFRESQFEQAQKELRELEKKGESFSWEETGKDWQGEIKNWEGFVYPWFEKKYGLEKLQELWQKMFKKGETITKAAEDVYNEKIDKLQENFTRDLLKAKNYLIF